MVDAPRGLPESVTCHMWGSALSFGPIGLVNPKKKTEHTEKKLHVFKCNLLCRRRKALNLSKLHFLICESGRRKSPSGGTERHI